MVQNIALIDWLSFSLPSAYDWAPYTTSNSVLPVLHELFSQRFPTQEDINDCGQQVSDTPYQIDEARGNWYRERHVISSHLGNPLVHVFLHPTAENNAGTSALSVTGHALSTKPDALQQLNPIETLRKVDAMGGKLTRIDLAFDYFGHEPILQYMKEASRPDVWKDRIITPLRFKEPVPVGWQHETLYYGRLKKKDQKSGTCICVYNKALQTGTLGPWLRIELRTGDRELCKTIQHDLLSGLSLGEVTAGLLGEYLRFVPPGRKKKYDRPTSPWWEDLLTAGTDYEFLRHRAGKTDEDSYKQRQPPSEGAFLRYINDALRLDDSGALAEALCQRAAEVQQAKKMVFR